MSWFAKLAGCVERAVKTVAGVLCTGFVVLLILAALATGVKWISSSSQATGADTATRHAASAESKIEVPKAYRVVAQHSTISLYTSRADATRAWTAHRIQSHSLNALMELERSTPEAGDIKFLRDQTINSYKQHFKNYEVYETMDEPSGFEIAKDILFEDDGFEIIKGIGKQISRQQAKDLVLKKVFEATTQIDLLRQQLPEIAKRYAASMSESSNRLTIDFDAGWGSQQQSDYIQITNHGETLRDCTLVVKITNADGETRTNVHFQPEWSTDATLQTIYSHGVVHMKKTYARRTVDNVQRVELTVYSPAFSTKINYTYAGKEKDQDVKDRCQGLAFHGKYQPFAESLLWNTQRSAKVKMIRGLTLPPCTVTVTFKNATQSKAFTWTVSEWKSGQWKTFEPTAGRLSFDPTEMEMTLSFPGTSYKHVVQFPVN